MIERVIAARRRSLGGFEVGRVLPHLEQRMVGPFVFFDHMGPIDLPASVPRTTDVRPHPHIGLSTITYLFSGEIVHRDSIGCEQVIRPGEVNWMTAGRGISHSERFDTMRERGGHVDGIQAWVALPEEHEETDPAFVHFDTVDLPVHERDGTEVRVIAGSAFGHTSRVPTHSRMFYAHLAMRAGASCGVPNYTERAAYIAAGGIQIGDSSFESGTMVVFAKASDPTFRALEDSTVMLLGGEPLGPRHIWWNFVSSRRERIDQAKADWKAGRIPLPVADSAEFMPLPEEPAPPPEPMS